MSSGNDAADAVNDLLAQYEAKLGNVAPKVRREKNEHNPIHTIHVYMLMLNSLSLSQSVGIQLGLSESCLLFAYARTLDVTGAR